MHGKQRRRNTPSKQSFFFFFFFFFFGGGGGGGVIHHKQCLTPAPNPRFVSNLYDKNNNDLMGIYTYSYISLMANFG